MTQHPIRHRGSRAGMTLIEIVVAVTILSGALLGIAMFASRMVRGVSDSQAKTTAAELAGERLELVKLTGTYVSVDTFVRTETALGAGYLGYTRQTQVQRINTGVTDTLDYKIVTVTVRGQLLPQPVKRTTIIAAY